MDLVLMGVKKGTFDKTKDSKRKEKIGQVGEQSRYRIYRA
ncbi:hypothetical protein AGMMS49593_10660 [Endomicrobiia bacterium]|nr:hypothetical protein AGMMS49593_10660 [Endomicrobiia bacterium]